MLPGEYDHQASDAVLRDTPAHRCPPITGIRYRGKFEQRAREFFKDIFDTPQENSRADLNELRAEEIEIQRSNAQQETGFISEVGKVTCDDLFFQVQMSTAIGNLMASFGVTPSQDKEIMRFRGMKDARSKASPHKARHQIMIIDDHLTLAAHKTDMVQAARVISYVGKTCDGSGLELYRAFPHAKWPRICKTSFQVQEAISAMHPVGGMCDMVNALKKVLDKVLTGNKIKPTSIYIYTDGVWKTDLDDLVKLILQAMDYLNKCGQDSKTLKLQFIQFGSDTKGTQQLQSVKNQLSQQVEGRYCNYENSEASTLQNTHSNIVDVRHSKDHIPDIVIGSIPE